MPKKSKQYTISGYEINNEIASINHELAALAGVAGRVACYVLQGRTYTTS